MKFQYFGHLMWRASSLEKTLIMEKLTAGGKGDDRGWGGWMASLIQWTGIWANSGRWWGTGLGMLESLGLQTVGHDLATEQQHKDPNGWQTPTKPHHRLNFQILLWHEMIQNVCFVFETLLWGRSEIRNKKLSSTLLLREKMSAPKKSCRKRHKSMLSWAFFYLKKNLGKMWSYLLSDFLNNFISLFFTVLILHFCMGFSLVGESGGYSSCSAWASHCNDFSYYRAWVPEHGLNIFSPLAWLLCRVWDLPRLGIELVSPALSGFWATREALAEFVCLFVCLQ